MPEPRFFCQSTLPSVASMAWNSPCRLPANTKLPAVVSVPPLNGRSSLMPHFFSCLTGSQAISSPRYPPGGRTGGNSPPRYITPRLYLGSLTDQSMQRLLEGMYTRPVSGLYDIGCQFLPPIRFGQAPLAGCPGPARLSGSSTARSVVTSHFSAQVTGTYFSRQNPAILAIDDEEKAVAV